MIFDLITPFQAALLCSLFFLSIPASGDISKTLYAGLTHTSNLEVQDGTDISANDQDYLTREGFETGISLIKQSLDYTGGYSFQADASFNKGLSDNNDISRLLISASKLSALNPDWLLRNNIGINFYDNEALPNNSYKGLFLETTFGYLDTAGGGSDISLSMKLEQHDQADENSYDMIRSGLNFTHYFSHEKDAAYWSLNGALRDNNANENTRDYDSVMLGINHKQWSFSSFKGQVGFNWQQDRYDRPVLLSPMGTVIPANGMQDTGMMTGTTNAIEKKRRDNLYYLSLQVGKPLTPSVDLQITGSLGIYDSNISDNSDDFYNVATHLIWNF